MRDRLEEGVTLALAVALELNETDRVSLALAETDEVTDADEDALPLSLPEALALELKDRVALDVPETVEDADELIDALCVDDWLTEALRVAVAVSDAEPVAESEMLVEGLWLEVPDELALILEVDEKLAVTV